MEMTYLEYKNIEVMLMMSTSRKLRQLINLYINRRDNNNAKLNKRIAKVECDYLDMMATLRLHIIENSGRHKNLMEAELDERERAVKGKNKDKERTL